jgi:hypothetical protein
MRLPYELYRRCEKILRKCHEFGDDRLLRSMFAVAELKNFKDKIPEAETIKDRVKLFLDFSTDQYLSDGRLILTFFLAILCDSYEGDARYGELKELIREIGEVTPPSPTSERQLSPYDLVNICNFDLNGPLNECLRILRKRYGLIVFAIATDSSTLVRNLCERLQRTWRRIHFINQDPIAISVVKPIEPALRAVKVAYRSAPIDKDVLLRIRLDNVCITEFYNNISECFRIKQSKRLVVVIEVNSSLGIPEEVIPLSVPSFEDGDVYDWVCSIVNYMNWPDDIVDYWTDTVFETCTYEGYLRPELVYMHLDLAVKDLKKQKPSSDKFKQTLRKWRESI